MSDGHNNTLFIQLSNDGKYWNVNSAGIFREKYSRRKPEVKPVPTIESSPSTDTAEVNHGHNKGATVTSGNSSMTSDGKVTNSASEKQETGAESSEKTPSEKVRNTAERLVADFPDAVDSSLAARLAKNEKISPEEAEAAIAEARGSNEAPRMSVGEEVGGNADAYNVTKGMLESAGIAIHEVGGEEAAAMLEQRSEDTRLMGSKTDRKMERIAEHYADKELDSNQRAVVDVFSGKRDNVAIEVEREDGKRRVIMRQGKEQNVGTKHSLLRHFETNSNYVTAEEIALIPEIIAKGERKVDGKRITYDYTAEDASRLRVTTETSKGREVFTNLMSNRKPQNVESRKPFGDTQSSAQATTSEVSGANLGNKEQTTKEIEGQKGEKLLKTPSGTVYGWVANGEVWLNRDAMNPETPLHEYTHLWDDMVRRENPELWERGKELLRQMPLWDEVVNDPNYADIAGDEDAVASEVHSRLVGRDGARLLEDMISKAKEEGEENTAKAANLVERIKGWLQDMFASLKKTLEKWSGQELADLTAEDFAKLTIRDLAEGMNPKRADNGLRFHVASERRGRYGRNSLGLFDEMEPGLFDNLDAIKNEQIEQPDENQPQSDVSDMPDAETEAVNASIDRYVEDFAGYIKAERELEADKELSDDEKDLQREQLEDTILDKRDMLQGELAAHFRRRGDSEADALLRARDMLSEIQAQVSSRLIDPERMKPELMPEAEGMQSDVSDISEASGAEREQPEQPAQSEPVDGSYRSAGGDVIDYTSEGWLPTLEDGEFCYVERKFVRDRQFDFTGSERIETADDVAYIFRQLESAAVEHAFVVYVKDGEPTVVHVGMGDVAMTLVSQAAARGAWDALGGADEVYFVHNHPSGTLNPSQQDRNMLKSLRGMFGSKLQDGIIIDTRSGKYGIFDEEKGNYAYDRPIRAEGEERQLTVSRFDAQVFSDDYDPEKLLQVRSSASVAEFVSSQRLGARGKVGLLVLDQGLKVVGNFHLPYTGISNSEELSELAVKLATRYGGRAVMLYGNYKNSRAKLANLIEQVNKKSGNNIRFLDSISVGNGLRKEYQSAMDEGMIGEPDVEYNDDADILTRPVTDPATLDRLNSEPTVKVYRAMQLIDGGLRPPMSAKVDGELREATEIGVWEEAEERPELADAKGKFKLNKGNGSSINAAYNPYIHTSRSPINDQFSSAWSRPELVTVEVEVPESELTSGYKADKAKDSVGEKEWKSGPVGRALAKIGHARRVILSRWGKVTRIVPVDEVAEEYAQRLNKHGISVPFNTVPPALREALVKHGVKISEPEKGNAGESSRAAYEEWLEVYDMYSAMSRGREDFDTLRERAIAERGIVMPGLNDAEVRVVEVERHDFTGTGRQAIDKARKWTEENLLGTHTYHIGQIDEFHYEIDDDAIDKYLSSSSTKGSDNLGVHMAALKKLPSIINSSLEVEIHADYSKKDGKRNAENGIRDSSTLIHRFYGAIKIDGIIYRVKTTIKEVRDKKITPYNYQVTELELLISGSESSDALSNSNFVDVAKLLQGVEKSYDSGKKLLDESKKNDESLRQASQNSETNSGEEKLSAMDARVRELAGLMHLDNVEIVRDSSTLSGKRAKAKGFFNRRTGKITIVLPNNADAADVAQTLLHEAVAHYGLRKLFGKDFEAFLDKVFESATPEVRGRIAQMSRQHDWDYLTATEEYLAALAEDTDFEKGFAAQGWWMRIKELFRAMLAKLGIGEAAQIGDKELRYTLWRSYQNLAHPGWESGPLGMAEAATAESDFDRKHEESEEEADYYRAIQSYNESVQGLDNQVKEAHHDGLRSLLALQDEVCGWAKVKDNENVYLHMMHKTSVDRVEQEDMERRILKPLEKVCDALRKKGLNGRMIDDYLICLHGEERNAYIGNKRQSRQDYSGLTGLFDPDGKLGLTVDQLEEEARKYVARIEGMAPAETKELCKLVEETSHWQLDKMMESGYISRETRDKLAKRYRHYVPLEGYDESLAEDLWDYAGNVRILNAPMIHRAEGTTSFGSIEAIC